jgi:NitT/TauT family transport system ATP-binding protein
MVSHDIGEVAYMADRIVVLSANPGRIRTIVENKLPRPRDSRATDFTWLLDHLHDIVTNAELPDVTTSPTSVGVTRDVVEPLPAAQTTDILGLLEYLDTQSGSCDLFQVAHDTHGTFVEVLTAVKGAEMLDLVDTPQRFVRLTPLGQKFVRSGMDERRPLWRAQLLKLGLFRVLKEMIDASAGEISRDHAIDEIQQRLPREDAARMFDTLVGWARVGGLFTYREDSQSLSAE